MAEKKIDETTAGVLIVLIREIGAVLRKWFGRRKKKEVEDVSVSEVDCEPKIQGE